MNEESSDAHGEEAEDAAFRADSATGEPGRTVQGSVREMALKDITAIGN